jgi:hypothetical protein
LPTGSTGATATTELNETENVLPMSPVRSVAYVPGCSAPGPSPGGAGEGLGATDALTPSAPRSRCADRRPCTSSR